MSDKMTRREFMRDTAAAAAVVTAGLAGAQTAEGAKKSTGKILNYNSEMEYRRCGRTGLMVSALGVRSRKGG